MQWVMGAGTLGGCGLDAVVAGVVGEIGSTRAFNPVNPCDIGPAPLPMPQPANIPPFSPVNILPLAGSLALYYPMTAHQRLYQWPATGIGPVGVFEAQSGWDVSKPPVEVTGQDGWPVNPVCAVPIMRTDGDAPVWKQDVITTTILPQGANSTREFWTLYRTMPWVPATLIRNVLLEGDTRKFYIRGVTLTALGAPLAGVNVRCLLSDAVTTWQWANPFVAEVISDGSGNFEFGVAPQLGYELIAYHESTDVGGITVDNLQSDMSVNIYCTTPAAPPASGSILVTNRILVR